MADTISDFLTVIRNAYSAHKESCDTLYSKVHHNIARILVEEGYVRSVETVELDGGKKRLRIGLKYVDEAPAITGLQRQSSPGRRLYYGYADIPRVLGGLGVAILTTSKGVLKDRDARRQKVGGELICAVW